ncbi:SGNH/GDSL hydrolase family protein [Nitrospira sp. M1]
MEAHFTNNRFEKYSKTVLTLLVIIVVVVADFVFTGVYHIQKYGTIHKFADRRALRGPSPVFHHTLKPNGQQQEQKWGHLSSPLYTNSLGFKDREIREIPLASSNFRFLVIGDSFTEGIGIDYEKTFVGLIDSELARRNIEVLNAAVSSYAPAIYFKKVEYLLETIELDFDHLIVFLDISDIEDEVQRYDIQDGRVIGLVSQTSKIKEFVYEYTGLLKNIWTVAVNMQKTLVPTHEDLRSEEERRYGLNQQRSLWTVNEEIFHEYGQRGLEKARKHMDFLYQLLQRHQKEMTLAVYPWPDQIVHKDLHSRQVTFWQEWAQQHSVTFFNFFPLFISPDTDPKEILREKFIEGDVHWNEQGHELMAQEVLRKMQVTFPKLL